MVPALPDRTLRAARRMAAAAVALAAGCSAVSGLDDLSFDGHGAAGGQASGPSSAGSGPANSSSSSSSSSSGAGAAGSSGAGGAAGGHATNGGGGAAAGGSAEGGAATGGGATGGGGCTGVCVPLPSGWSGPVTYVTDPIMTPSCAGGAAVEVDGQEGFHVDSFCSGCTCQGNAANCAPMTVKLHGAPTCSGATKTLSLNPTVCVAVSAFSTYAIDASPPGVLSSPGCTPHGTAAPIPPYWDANSALCASPKAGGTCAGGACVASSATGPFCVYRSGDYSCPAGFSGAQHTIYGGVQDNRTCTASCGCGPATGVNCNQSIRLFAASGCGMTSTLLTDPSGGLACAPLASAPVVVDSAQYSPSPGTCAHTTIVTSGTAVPTGPVTVCCAP